MSSQRGEAVDVESRATDSPARWPSLDHVLASVERREIVAALRRAKGQRTLAARMLGISRSRLYRRMEALGVEPNRVSV